MRKQRSLILVAMYLLLGAVALMTVRGGEAVGQETAGDQPTGPQSEGSARQISDWALAGYVWSDASLAKKIAVEAARTPQSDQKRAALLALAKESDGLIRSLESFGWMQVDPAQQAANVSPGAAARNRQKPLTRPADASDAVLPERMPNRMSDRIGEASGSPVSARSPDSNDPGVLDAGDGRTEVADTETPLGVDDPGIDDERIGQPQDLDIGHYRVDDYIDETPMEARNRADAIEDGIEGAIASAPPRGIDGSVAGHVSKREVMTRSATMPYSVDSIYDRDDFDPDVDYDIDNPLGVSPTNPQSADRGDLDDDIDAQNPAKVIDGEDELGAAIARNLDARTGRAPIMKEAARPQRRPVRMANFTGDGQRHAEDADWVQMHLDVNQRIWSRLRDGGNLDAAAAMARQRLRSSIDVAMMATSDARLKRVLSQVAQ